MKIKDRYDYSKVDGEELEVAIPNILNQRYYDQGALESCQDSISLHSEIVGRLIITLFKKNILDKNDVSYVLGGYSDAFIFTEEEEC